MEAAADHLGRAQGVESRVGDSRGAVATRCALCVRSDHGSWQGGDRGCGAACSGRVMDALARASTCAAGWCGYAVGTEQRSLHQADQGWSECGTTFGAVGADLAVPGTGGGCRRGGDRELIAPNGLVVRC